MDALQQWFFWTWKIGRLDDVETTMSTAPFWDYQLGLRDGWIPKDPRDSVGVCRSVGGLGDEEFEVFDGQFPPSATATASQATSTISLDGLDWPPVIGPFALPPSATQRHLATYTQTGVPVTLDRVAQPTSVEVRRGNDGWSNANDTIGAWARVRGCVYPE